VSTPSKGWLATALGTAPPNFRPMSIADGQTAGWIKMPLGTEVGLSPGHIVLDGAIPPPKKEGGTAPNFPPVSVVAGRPSQLLLST